MKEHGHQMVADCLPRAPKEYRYLGNKGFRNPRKSWKDQPIVSFPPEEEIKCPKLVSNMTYFAEDNYHGITFIMCIHRD
jgi:hypothetical protein